VSSVRSWAKAREHGVATIARAFARTSAYNRTFSTWTARFRSRACTRLLI